MRKYHSPVRYFTLLAVVFARGMTGPVQAAGPSQDELDRSAAMTDSWLMTNKSYDGHRYVALDQINTSNINQLKEACTYDSGVAGPTQSTPVLYEGRIYFSIGPTTVAIDAANCSEIWRSEWKLKGKALSNPNRGVAIKDGLAIRGTPEGYLIALDMANGNVLWERQITSAEKSHYLSMPAMIVEDTVIYGTAGADWGGRGWIGAFKLKDGEELWRFHALPQPGDPNAGTWGSPEALEHGGGSFWTPVSVDRERNLVYVPVGNPAPDFFGNVRKGINLYTNSLVALDLRSGKPVWWKQFVPHDIRDWDLTQTSPLITADFHGQSRKLVVVSAKDGRLRLVDRDSHEVLTDLAISKQENTDVTFGVEGTHICPGLLGGQEWSSSAFDPVRKFVFSPMGPMRCAPARSAPNPRSITRTRTYPAVSVWKSVANKARPSEFSATAMLLRSKIRSGAMAPPASVKRCRSSATRSGPGCGTLAGPVTPTPPLPH